MPPTNATLQIDDIVKQTAEWIDDKSKNEETDPIWSAFKKHLMILCDKRNELSEIEKQEEEAIRRLIHQLHNKTQNERMVMDYLSKYIILNGELDSEINKIKMGYMEKEEKKTNGQKEIGKSQGKKKDKKPLSRCLLSNFYKQQKQQQPSNNDANEEEIIYEDNLKDNYTITFNKLKTININ